MADRTRLAELLLVQDDPVDELIARDDFAVHKVVNRMLAVRDVRSALAYLDGISPFAEAHIPDVVLLDLNLPWPGGEALLQRLRERPDTAAVPVILMVDSPAAEQLLRSRELPVDGYLTKPLDFPGLAAVVQSVADIGFEVRRT